MTLHQLYPLSQRFLSLFSSDIGRYALYCQRSLERTLENGERETRSSRLEVSCYFLDNKHLYKIIKKMREV